MTTIDRLEKALRAAACEGDPITEAVVTRNTEGVRGTVRVHGFKIGGTDGTYRVIVHREDRITLHTPNQWPAQSVDEEILAKVIRSVLPSRL